MNLRLRRVPIQQANLQMAQAYFRQFHATSHG